MEQGVEHIGETPGLGKCAPFEQSFEHRLRVALVVKPRQVFVFDREEGRSPRLEPVRAAAGFVNSSEQVENVGGLAGLEQPVLLVKRKRDSRLTQVLANFRTVAVGPSKDVNVLGCNLARLLLVITNFYRVIRFRNNSPYRLRDSRTHRFAHRPRRLVSIVTRMELHERHGCDRLAVRRNGSQSGTPAFDRMAVGDLTTGKQWRRSILIEHQVARVDYTAGRTEIFAQVNNCR